MEFTGERVVPGKTPLNTYEEHLERYKFAVSHVAGKIVLDVACGTGYGTQIMAPKAKRVTGIDIDRETIAYAQANFPHPRAIYQVGDVQSLPLPTGSIEAVVSFETIEHVRDGEKCIREAWRVLKRGGIYLASTPLRTTTEMIKLSVGPFVNIFHAREYSLDEFIVMLKQYFPRIILFGQRFYHNNYLSGPEIRPFSPGENPMFIITLSKKL